MASYVVVNYRQTRDQRSVADLARDGRIVLGGQNIGTIFDYVAQNGARGDTYQEIDMPRPVPIEQVWADYMARENSYR